MQREGVVTVVARHGRLLVIKRAEGLLAGGAWCFVGGGIEAGEDQAAAAVREFREEVAGAIRPERKIWEYTRPDGGLKLHWWRCTLLPRPLVANPAEVAELRWLEPAAIQALPQLLASNRAFLASPAFAALDLAPVEDADSARVTPFHRVFVA